MIEPLALAKLKRMQLSVFSHFNKLARKMLAKTIDDNPTGNKEAHIGKMESQFRHGGATLDGLKVKVDAASDEMRDEYKKRVEDLKAMHIAAQAKLNDLKATSGDSWEALRAGVDGAWKELEATIKKLSKQLCTDDH